ncbi:MAG: substrate-binding domain-containing protein [Deltaproteobacteria bacterium]|nr:substrate-binding domain-containing protein [Deltaproteobacteria bacterium]MBI3293859.1 substrate-binding domain-containing protein [Deltaproteobacteria bacterium]
MTFRFGSLFLLCCASILSNCTRNAGVVGEKPVRIGFVLATMNEERYSKDREYFTNFAKTHGATVEFASCDDKVDVQTAKVETLLSKKVDVLVVQPVNGETAGTVVSMAKRDGVPVVAYDRLIRNADIDLYVTQDSFQVGVLQAQAAVKATHEKGNYVILMGEAGHSVAEEITKGVLSVLRKYPNIKVVLKQNHPGWSTALALTTVENTLTRQKNNIQAILANNDGMAMGAIKALDEQKLAGQVFVAGADADLSAVKDIMKGKQSMTVLKGIKPLAEAAVMGALELAAGKAPTHDSQTNNGKRDVWVMNTPVFEVNQSNIKSQVVEYGFHTAAAVYGGSGT